MSSSSSSSSSGRVDPCSFANVNEAALTHFHLEWNVDFSTSTISGAVTLRVVSRIVTASTLILDSNHLTINSVINQDTNTPLKYTIGARHEAFGSPIEIKLPESAAKLGATTNIRISYSTTSASSACQWLPASQTAGKQHPYLFTQCQAIHCRSLIPIQDTPAIKCTYTAAVTVAAPLTALMSALRLGSSTAANGSTTTFLFEQRVPIPAYLVALAVGRLESRTLGPRSCVWSEPELVNAAAYEFAQTEEYLQTAEKICGPYVWKQYDLLLLPPSFPYGGMENPCLTFVTPTLLAGDRSLTYVVAHEIAHSWTGNLVGCHTWESFWLNEGWTVFIERKIGQHLDGKANSHLDATSGWRHLHEAVSHFGESHPFTCLHCKLDNVDPDDAFSSVPYEKGYTFLFYLEQLVTESLFDEFVLKYISNFAYKTVTNEQFKQFFIDYFTGKVDKATLDQIDWDTWYHKPGMPTPPKFDTSLVDAATQLATQIATSGAKLDPATLGDISGWKTTQRVVMLEKLQEQQAVATDKAAFAQALLIADKKYNFTGSGNSEIKFRWSQLAIRAGLLDTHPNIAATVVAFVTGQGRMKYVRPIYRDLYQLGGATGKKLAVDTFLANKTRYHAIAQKMCAKDLEIKE